MKRIAGVSAIAILLVGWNLEGQVVEKEKQSLEKKQQKADPAIGMVFDKVFGKSKFADPQHIMILPSGFMIGYENSEFDKRKGIIRFSNVSVVQKSEPGKNNRVRRPAVAICSKSGVASVYIPGRADFFTEMAESIRSIRFHDGSSFHFPTGNNELSTK